MSRDDGGRIRLVVFELEGSNETLQESMRTIASALQPRPPAHARLPVSPANGGNRKSHNFGAAQPALDYDAIDVESEPETKHESRKSSNKARVYPTPKIIELDLESSDVPFKAFWKQKNPIEQSKRYLVIAAWLHLYRSIDDVTDDHIYTCYRTMGLNVPKDVSGPLRKMKQAGWFGSGKSKGSFAINHVGLGEVNKIGSGSA